MVVYDYIVRFLLTFRVCVRKQFLTYLHTWLFIFILVGCEESEPNEPTYYLNITMDTDSLMRFENEEFVFNYPRNKPSTYARVLAETDERNGRIFWFSPDSFQYIYQGILFTESVINYSTYCYDEVEWRKFECQQLVYLNETMIGDTIDIYGYLGEDEISETRFVVK